MKKILTIALANLMAHHLRVVGRMDTVSQGTPREVHIFNATDEQRQLAVITGRNEAEALCGETVGNARRGRPG